MRKKLLITNKNDSLTKPISQKINLNTRHKFNLITTSVLFKSSFHHIFKNFKQCNLSHLNTAELIPT